MTNGYLRVKIGGVQHTRLRSQIDKYLLDAWHFSKMKRGRALVNHFERYELSAKDASKIISALFDIAHSFGPRAHIKEITISSFPSLLVQMKNA